MKTLKYIAPIMIAISNNAFGMAALREKQLQLSPKTLPNEQAMKEEVRANVAQWLSGNQFTPYSWAPTLISIHVYGAFNKGLEDLTNKYNATADSNEKMVIRKKNFLYTTVFVEMFEHLKGKGDAYRSLDKDIANMTTEMENAQNDLKNMDCSDAELSSLREYAQELVTTYRELYNKNEEERKRKEEEKRKREQEEKREREQKLARPQELKEELKEQEEKLKRREAELKEQKRKKELEEERKKLEAELERKKAELKKQKEKREREQEK